MYDSMEIMNDAEKEHISRLHDVLSKLVFWKRRSSLPKTRSMPAKSSHSPAAGKPYERSRTTSARSHRLFERKRSFRTESTVSSHSPISHTTTTSDVDETLLSTSWGWWGEETDDHVSLLPSSRHQGPMTNDNEEEGEEYDAFEDPMETFWVPPGMDFQAEEEEKKEESVNLDPRQLLEELEVLSHAISVAQSEGDGMTAEEMASIEEHVSVWLRVRERIRGALRGVFRKKSSPSPAVHNKKEVLPGIQKDTRRMEAETIPLPPSPPPIPSVLQLNSSGVDGVEVQFPLFAEGDVDLSRVEETTSNELDTDFGYLDAQKTTKGSLEQDDTELSVAMDPKDNCVQLVLVRSEDESARHTRSSSGNGNSEESSSLLLNDFPPIKGEGALGAAFPFKFDIDQYAQSEELEEAPGTQNELSKDNLTPERPQVQPSPIATRSDVEDKDLEFHDAPDEPKTPSSPDISVSRRRVQNLFMDEDEDENVGDFSPYRQQLSSHALQCHDSSMESGLPTVIKPDMETATVSTLTHRRVASSDNVWAEIEAKNGSPFDEPSHQSKSQEPQKTSGHTLMKMVQENFFQPIVRYAQEDFLVCGGKHPDSPTKKLIAESTNPPSQDLPESIPAEGLNSSYISSLTHPQYVPEPAQENDAIDSSPTTNRLATLPETVQKVESANATSLAGHHDQESVLSAFDPTDFSNYASAAAESSNYEKSVSARRRHRSTVNSSASSKVSV